MYTAVVVTPIGNERDHINTAIEEMGSVIQGSRFYEIVWMPTFNDFCTDGTYEYLRDLSQRSGFEWIRVIRINSTKSLAHAYIAGYKAALQMSPDFIAEADIGHPYHYLPSMFDQLVSCPVVFGTRFGRSGNYQASVARKWLSKTGTWLSRFMLGFRMSDGTGGFQGFRREVLEQVPFHRFIATGHLFQTEIKCYCSRLDFAEIEYPYVASQSSLDIRSVVEAGLLFPRLMDVKPIDPVGIQ